MSDTKKLIESMQTNLNEDENTTLLDRAMKEEVRYWIEALADENTNDATGQRALELLDNEEELNKITDAIINDDDIWETIHIKIEQYGGLEGRY